MTRIDLESFVWRNECGNRYATWYSTLLMSFFQNNIYEVWWVFYPGNIFLVDLYHETLGPGVSMGSYPFPFGIQFVSISMRKPILPVAGDQASIPGVNRVLSPKNCECFFLPTKILSETQLFFRSFKTVISSTNSGSHCLSRKCRTYTFNNFSLVKWESRNGGDLFGRTKIDTAKSCIQLLQSVLLYRGHLYKELYPGIFRYSKEWKSFTIDIVPKSA